MLCTFTTNTGEIIIRSDDIRSISDHSEGYARLVYVIGDMQHTVSIEGTARENRDRILQEELDQIGTVELHRYKTQQLLAAQPQPRGRQNTK